MVYFKSYTQKQKDYTMAQKSIFKAMKKFLSTDTSRTSLCGYYIELDHGNFEATITATDGHVLCSHKKDLESLKFDLVQEYNFLPEDFDTLENFVVFPNVKTRGSYGLYETNSQYPRYENIIPKIENMTRIDELEHFILTDLKMGVICCEAKKYFGMDNSGQSFDYANGKLNACLSDSNSTRVLIMPLTMNTEH